MTATVKTLTPRRNIRGTYEWYEAWLNENPEKHGMVLGDVELKMYPSLGIIEVLHGSAPVFKDRLIATIRRDSGITSIFSNDVRTVLRKLRINHFLRDGYQVVQRQGNWYLKTPQGALVRFYEGISIMDGRTVY